jgi:hypothetical protein
MHLIPSLHIGLEDNRMLDEGHIKIDSKKRTHVYIPASIKTVLGLKIEKK